MTESVRAGVDFFRIKALTRRRWADSPHLPELVARITAWLRTPTGTQALLPMQAAALAEMHEHGCVCNASMGGGKSLCAWLAPVVLGAKRPLFITYKKLLKKSRLHLARDAEHWRVCNNFEWLSCETLSRQPDILNKINPDCIIADESHWAGNPRSGRAKVVREYLRTHDCHFIPLTATPGESLKTQSHLAQWALGKVSPIPARYNELMDWCAALDDDVEQRMAPGCLSEWDPEDIPTHESTRAAVGRRIAESPGYIVSHDSDNPCALYLSGFVFNGYSAATENAFAAARDEWRTPSGREFAEGADLHRVLQTLSLGFVHTIDKAPDDWNYARRNWMRFCSDDLTHNRSGRFTPFAVETACVANVLDSDGVFEAWRDIRKSFKPTRGIEWIDDAALLSASEYLHDGEVVWCPYPAWSERLAGMTGVPYFGAGNDAIEEFTGPKMILSVGANATGRNLQQWSRALVAGIESTPTALSQLIGRHHRRGQKAESVDITFFLGCRENLLAVERARTRSLADRDLNQNESGKLLAADWLLPEMPVSKSRRWSMKKGSKLLA